MKEKELRKILTEKQKEIEKVQREYETMKYVNQINAICDEIRKSPAIISIIKEKDLNACEARLLGACIATKISDIYTDSAEEIDKNKERRIRKNEARKERRARKAVRVSDSDTAAIKASDKGSGTVKTLPNITGSGGPGHEKMRQY
ncbi:MAG: hypothetical protein IJ058_10145 [Lachnospiraceae bacterium]|nr:hypothetical protein [Lachnospiraceae bacterium]